MKIKSNTLSYFLIQPYPFYMEGKKIWKALIVIFFITLSFNYLLQPFDVNHREHRMNYFWISVIHSTTPLIILLFMSFIIRKFPKIVDAWNIKKEFQFIFIILILIGIVQFLVRDIIYDNSQNWSGHYLFEEISNTLFAGFFIAAIIIPINMNALQLKNQQKADIISSAFAKVKEIEISSTISIETDVKSEKFIFDSNRFLYAKSEGNYIEIYFKNDDSIIKMTKRLSLKNLENQLQDFKFIIKTHRSVLMNFNTIENVSGNAQGYKIKLKECLEILPVSRNYIKTFESQVTLI